MGYIISNVQYGCIEYVADSESEVDLIPTDCAPGSTIFVIENSNVYMLNTLKQWVLIG